MDNQKFELILDSLLKQSIEGKLDWKNTASLQTYLLVLKDSSITIWNVASVGIVFNFRDEKGNTVDEIRIFKGSDARFEKADKLFDLARRKATNADKTIDRILEQLNSGSITA
jgi:hypothetical protein